VFFIQSRLQTRASSVSRPPLQPSLSLPLESIYHAELTGVAANDTAFPPTRLPAPKLADRRSQSFGEASTLYHAIGQDVPGLSKQASTTAPTRYKTELCRPFEENGTCRYGSKCQFAHGKAELRSVVRHPKYKTDLCRTFHTTGLCPYGPRCHFIHNDDERRTSDSSEQMRHQLAAAHELGRRSTSMQPGLEERHSRLQRQYSDYQSGDDRRQRTVPLSANVKVGAAADLQRRASSVADAVIRNSIGYQQQLHTVPESSTQYPGAALNLNIANRSLGSSSASSVTDSPSPSPTGGLLLPAVDDSVTSTAPVRQPPAAPVAWSADDDRAKAALLAELVARLGPQDVAALIRALHLPGTSSSSTSGPLSRGMDGSDVDGSMPQWQSEIWSQYQHLCQQQQQNGHTASNICW